MDNKTTSTTTKTTTSSTILQIKRSHLITSTTITINTFQAPNSKRRRFRETTIIINGSTRKLDPLAIVSSNSQSWCCSPTSTLISDDPPPSLPVPPLALPTSSSTRKPDPDFSAWDSLKIQFLQGKVYQVMDFNASNGHLHHSPNEYTTSSSSSLGSVYPSNFSKFNSALTAGLLNPMSPPPPPPIDKARSSPTLFEMMANEPEIHPKTAPTHNILLNQNRNFSVTVQDRQALSMQRINELLTCKSPGNQFNDSGSSDVKLTLSSKDGLSVSLSVHKQILVAHSRFFAVKLSDRWNKQKGNGANSTSSLTPFIVEIADCDDVEVYIETLRLMYCKDLRRRLMRDDVSKILGILKVSAAIGFDAGVLSCLEYLEAAPWAEEEEEKVASLLSELRLEGVGAGEVLKRVSVEVPNGTEESGYDNNEEVLVKLLNVVLEGKDEKARREMKGLVLKMLRENSSHNDLRKESLYSACDDCLQMLKQHFLQAAAGNSQEIDQIAKQSDNLHWLLDILIDRQIGEDFLKTWASQCELAEVHSKIPAVHRHEISRVTARLFVGLGKGQLLASKDVRCLLLKTWLTPFYDDFAWTRRASRGLDRHLIEEGLSNTILTLPLAWQQEILLGWFNRFLNSGEDCPNIQRAFEAWWRRAFSRRPNGEPEQPRLVRVATATFDNS